MKLRDKYPLYKWFLIIALGFWAIETIYFLFVDGWHWTAVRQEEKICDNIVVALLICSCIAYIKPVIVAIYEILTSDE